MTPTPHITDPAAIEAASVKIWYMRDNHTFRPLPLDVEQAIATMRDEFDEGATCGMLCSKHPDLRVSIHAHGSDRWTKFEEEARPWLEKAVAINTALTAPADHIAGAGGMVESRVITNLVQLLRTIDWDRRTPREVADMIAAKLLDICAAAQRLPDPGSTISADVGEPVADLHCTDEGFLSARVRMSFRRTGHDMTQPLPLYASPPQTEALLKQAVEALEQQHSAIDKLMAQMILADANFMPSKSQAWAAVEKAATVLAAIRNHQGGKA